jgi:hypothetical protein
MFGLVWLVVFGLFVMNLHFFRRFFFKDSPKKTADETAGFGPDAGR